ncbi:hypothetical protein [Bosea beijingensis]
MTAAHKDLINPANLNTVSGEFRPQ